MIKKSTSQYLKRQKQKEERRGKKSQDMRKKENLRAKEGTSYEACIFLGRSIAEEEREKAHPW